jgi:arylsulfatase A-like enzyme
VLVLFEWAVVSWRARGEFAGPWETREGIWALAPLTWIQVAPIAVALAAALALLRARALTSAAARMIRVGFALIAAGGVMIVGYGTSHGRHFASLPLRASFIAALGAVGFAIAYVMGPRVARAVEEAPERSGATAALVAIALEIANTRILPGLYPAFHVALTVLTAMTAYAMGRALDPFASSTREGTRGRWAASLLAALWLLAIARSKAMARRPLLTDNLKLIFVEHAPLMGRGVELATMLAPPGEATATSGETIRETEREARLAVDWRGRDILLISVDALRADHVGAYGYSRATTPHLDALAREGTVFAHAYCPTPHTSYSIASMMTGKALRPLLTHGLGGDSDTLAGILRTYGYRTAAFYPPAVFFVDAEFFGTFQERKLDFEYARVEFADAPERARAVSRYLAAPSDGRLLLWVHLFEPHEPYLAHPEHPFGDRDVDRYDSEIAQADEGIGAIVGAVRSARPSAVIVITADHGEAFGEHDGRYHGTAVYEEQVRVPLVVVTPGLAGGRRIAAPVQTIDILPTILSALDIPRPPRIGGHDLGRALRGGSPAGEGEPVPPAFAETDEQVLLAEDEWRLVCTRRAGACALYDVDVDPGETDDVARAHTTRVERMKAGLRGVEVSHGRYESGTARAARPWPEAIRRGIAKDGEAAGEIAALLDDTDVVIRRKAAELLFDLKRETTAPALSLALARDDDPKVRSASALALTRLGQNVPQSSDLLKGPDENARRLAALAFAENGDRRGATVLASWWQAEVPSFERARDVLQAMSFIRDKEAVPALIRSLDDVRLRSYVAETLGAIGQPSARAPLAERFASERYQNARVAIGEALVRLGAGADLVEPLVRFLGTPDPLPNGLDLAVRAGILTRVGGPAADQLDRLRAARASPIALAVQVRKGGNGAGRRILVRAHVREGRGGEIRVEVVPGQVVTLDFTPGPPAERFATISQSSSHATVRLIVTASPEVAIDALAVVPLADELPPPPPEPWRPAAEETPPATARVPRPD